MAFVFTCASASSHTSRGASEHSAAQSRKLDRNPWGTAPIPRSRTSFEIATSESGAEGSGPGAASERRGPVSGADGLVPLSSGTGPDPSAGVRLSGVHPQTAAIAAAADPLSRNRLRDQTGIDVIFFTASA